MENKTLISKGANAKLRDRSPGAISQWIASGKISKAAIVGDGRDAKIWKEQADADLELFLDPTPDAPGAQAGDIIDMEVAKRFRAAKAEIAEHEARAAYRRQMAKTGKWVEVEGVQKEFNRETKALFDWFENFLFNILPKALAEKLGTDWKELSSRFRKLWYAQRETIAADAAKRLEKILAEESEHKNDASTTKQEATS